MKKGNTYEKINFPRPPRKKGHLPFLFSLHAKPTSNSLLNRSTPTSQYRDLNSISSLLSRGVTNTWPRVFQNSRKIIKLQATRCQGRGGFYRLMVLVFQPKAGKQRRGRGDKKERKGERERQKGENWRMEETDKFWKSFQHRTRLPSVPSETSLCSIMRRRYLPHLFSRFSLLSTLYASTSFLFSSLFAREICKPSTMVLPVFLISGYINQSITNHGIQPSVWPLVNKRQRQREPEPPWRLLLDDLFFST